MDFEHGKAVVSRFNDCVNAGDRVSEWRVLEDNASNRHVLGLQ
jgi:hypothetical protein